MSQQQLGALAAKLKEKPEDLAARLARLSGEEQKVCLELGIDPDEFARQKTEFAAVTAATNGEPVPTDSAPIRAAACPLALSQPFKALVAKLKAKPDDLAVRLAKLSDREQHVCLKLGIDPDEFARQKTEFGAVTAAMPI
jgi:glutamate dehydrogenase/leucine dehydrogenase